MKIFFVPGLLCTNAVWGVVNNIRSEYYCYDADVISFDTIEKMSNALVDSIASDDAVIIGISMGGYVAIDAALKLQGNLKKLILINTTPSSVDTKTIPERKKAIQLAEKGVLKEIMEMSKGVCYYEPAKEWLLLEEEMAHSIGSKAYVNQQKAIMYRKDYSDVIKNIRADTLIIASKNDKVIPFEDSFYMAQQIQNSSLVLLNRCGHLSTLEKGYLVLDCIQKFLEA